MRNAWIWIVVIVVIAAGGFIWWQSMQSTSDTNSLTSTTVDTSIGQVPSATTTDTIVSTTTSAEPSAMGPVTITYDGKSYSPAMVTVKKGDSVKWVSSGGQMWVATASHPAHTGYDGTSRSAHCAQGYTGAAPFDECSPGSTYTFVFDKVGTWPYHDHINPSAFGKVVVTE